MTVKRLVQTIQAAGLLLLASQAEGLGACDNFDAARKAAYFPYITGVSDEITAAQKNSSGASINTVIGDLSNTYLQHARAGDGNAVRKLIGLGLFTAYAAKQEPLDVTFKLVCESAKQRMPPINVADPLACATIALDGTRRANAENRTLAKDMITLARSNLTTDRDTAGAKKLFDTVANTALACAAP